MKKEEILKIVEDHPKHISLFIQKYDVKFYSKIQEIEGKTFSEKLYTHLYGKGYCKYCGKPTGYHKFKTGFFDYCSVSCQNKDKIKTPKYTEGLTVEDLKKKINIIIDTIPSDVWTLFKQEVADIWLNLIENTSYLPEDSKAGRRFYHILNNLEEIPLCPICQKRELTYRKGINGYSKTCNSKKCKKLIRSEPEKYIEYDDIVFGLTREDIKRLVDELDGNPLVYYSSFAKKYSKTIFHLTSFFRYKTSYNLRLQAILDDVYEQPKCKTCGKMLHYKGVHTHEHCSIKCMTSNDEVKKKREETNLKKHGYSNLLSDSKIRHLAVEKYTDDDSVVNLSQIPEIREKVKQTNLKNIGHENSFQSEKSYKNRIKGLRKFYNSIIKDEYVEGHVYVIECKSLNLIKIGISKNPYKRKKDIEKSLNKKCNIFFTKSFNYKLSREVENYLHEKYDAFNVVILDYDKKIGRTEWFKEEILEDVINDMKKL